MGELTDGTFPLEKAARTCQRCQSRKKTAVAASHRHPLLVETPSGSLTSEDAIELQLVVDVALFHLGVGRSVDGVGRHDDADGIWVLSEACVEAEAIIIYQ